MQAIVRSSRWLAATLSTEGLIAALSSSAEQFTGYSAKELVGRPITEILADSSAFQVPQILNAAKEWGYWEGDMRHRTRSGDSLEARGALTSLSGKGNLPDGFLLVSNLNREPSVNESENSAVADIAVDLRTMAHDLNNPLAVIMGFAQLLVLDSNCKGKVRTDVEKLYSELQSVIRIVERLHGYALSLHEKSRADQKHAACAESA